MFNFYNTNDVGTYLFCNYLKKEESYFFVGSQLLYYIIKSNLKDLTIFNFF